MSFLPLFLFLCFFCPFLFSSPVSVVSTSYSALHSQPPEKPRTLVLLEDRAIIDTHSRFFDSLRSRGHELEFSHVSEDSPILGSFGSWAFDGLIIFAAQAEDFGEKISIENLIEFSDSGRGILIASEEIASEPLREILESHGLDLAEDGEFVKGKAGENIQSNNFHRNARMFAPALLDSNKKIYYRGLSHSFLEVSRFQLAVLQGEAGQTGGSEEGPAGSDLLLVSAVQSENNGRLLFSGSLSMFSNEFFDLPNSGNSLFTEGLAKWAFFESGLLRAHSLDHRVRGSSAANLRSYRVSDALEFSLVVEEFDGAAKAWRPFVTSDLQLEFTMIDPHIRTTLKHAGSGRYFTPLTVPDNYGVFKFSVDYLRPGVTRLIVSDSVSIRPFRHDEYERFILAAFPYYTAAFSIMAAFFIFGFAFLYSKPQQK